MEDDLLSARYQRNFKSLTIEEQLRLKSSTVAIVGCGGIGGYLAEEFARLGVGHLILIDGDRIEESNLNRQLFALEDNLGDLKVEAAQSRLFKVNSSIKVDTYAQWFTEDTGASLLKNVDLVCDALDNGQTRVELERVCHDLNNPLVLAGIGGWYGILGVSFPGEFIAPKLFGKQRGIEEQQGNPAFAPAVIASLAVAESVKILIGRGTSLRNSFLCIDLLNMDFLKYKTF